MRDEWFIRGEVPMTKSEVRAVSLSKLELKEDSVLLDIGAGTGSVCVEAALCHPVRRIYALEKKAEALELLERNRMKAGMAGEKIVIVPGTAPESFQQIISKTASEADSVPASEADSVPASEADSAPGSETVTHAFIGGSSGNMRQLLEGLMWLNRTMRVVINAIALETVAEVLQLLKENEIEAEIVSVQVSRAREAGAYHLMQGQNPVYVISFGGAEE